MILDPNGFLVQGFILCTGIIGQLYVSHMNVRGFYFWLAGNIVLVAVSLHFQSYGAAGLYVYYSVMALYSISNWKKLQRKS